MSFEACARIVEKGDPDRFLATMSAPLHVRRVLFPIYAFNVEVARAPWVTEEPMIAEMRLQWWRDALEEIAEGSAVRRHEVTTPLAEVLDIEGAQALDAVVAARRWDIYKDTFEDHIHFEEYINATSAPLMWTAARLVGARDDQKGELERYAFGVGVANWLRAVPELEARGRKPMYDGRMENVALQAKMSLRDVQSGREFVQPVSADVAAVLRAGWRAEATLKTAIKNPERVIEGALDESPFARKFGLMWRTMRAAF